MEPMRLVMGKYTRYALVLYLCLTFVDNVKGVCYSDSSLQTVDKTSVVAVVVKARVQGWAENGDLHVRVTKTLKGDHEFLDKRDITVTGLEAGGPVRLGATEPVVTNCMQDAIIKEKYILFLQKTEDENVYNLQFDGILNSKEELRVVRKVIENENDSYNSSSSPDHLVTHDNSSTELAPEPSLDTSPTSHYVGCSNQSGFCLNGGQCAMLVKLKKYFCFCPSPWIGERCKLHDPYLQRSGNKNNILFDNHMQTTLITMGIIFGALLLLAVICAAAYVRHKSSYYTDKREELEHKIIELRSTEQLQRQHRHQNNNYSNERYSTSEIQNLNNTSDSSRTNHLHLGLETRHYSLLPPDDRQTPGLQRAHSDNVFSSSRTSVV